MKKIIIILCFICKLTFANEYIQIAIPNFMGTDDNLRENMTRVISDNLNKAYIFLPFDPYSEIDNNFIIPDICSKISLYEHTNKEKKAMLADLQAPYLICGEVKNINDKISVEYKLYDTEKEFQIVGRKYETSKKNYRRIAHIISDNIFETITGEWGIFDSRIVYIAATGPKENQQTRLAIMDWDQANHRFLTDGSHLVASPRFSPNSQKLAYVSYINQDNPSVYIFDLETGQQNKVGEFPNITFGPRFSPDGRKIIMSYADPTDGNIDIYTIDLETRVSKRITTNSSIDISPSYSPSGDQIVFNSNRNGTRQLFITDSEGGNTKQISKQGGSYYAPVWSPKGDKIAFAKQESGQFYIGVMEIDGSNERMIAKSFYIDSPAWAPNGNFIMYHKTARTSDDGSGGQSSLYFIDLTGYNEVKVITPLEGSQPHWSKIMHKDENLIQHYNNQSKKKPKISTQETINIKITPFSKPVF